MDIQSFDLRHPRWTAFVAHLERANMARWVVEGEDRAPLPDLLFLGAVVDDEVVGNLSLRKQVVTAPPTEWSGDARPLTTADGRPLHETYVMTFSVDEHHRRRGIGRALQEAALVATREAGCVQMRSWSSLDRPENYELKLSLGFAIHPEVHHAAGGLDVSGVYFVKRVDA